MQLLNTVVLGHRLQLEATMAGWQRVFLDGDLVSERVAGYPAEGLFEHGFDVMTPGGTVPCSLRFEVQWTPFSFRYEVLGGEGVSETGERSRDDIERSVPEHGMPAEPRKAVSLGLLSLAFKLLKSAKAFKVLLGASTVAAYSWLFSLQFALCLVGCLIIHEYGHLRAMKYFGMKTRGIYLIPFVGGLAVTEDRMNTRWQNVFIALMGPFFGMVLSLVALGLYWITGEVFFAGLATFNALLNLFNLLPVLPLDGGHVLKSVSFSMGSRTGVVLCVLGVGVGVWVSYHFGLTLLGFLLFIGALEIMMEWKLRYQSTLLPMGSRACTFATLWYVTTVLVLVGVMLYCGSLGSEVLGVPLQVLQG